MKIGSIVLIVMSSIRCGHSGSKDFTTFIENQRKTGGSCCKTQMEEGRTSLLTEFREKRSGKRSRFHLDLYTSSRDTEVERLLTIGAKRYLWRYRPNSDFVVLEDPDGNLFCVVQRGENLTGLHKTPGLRAKPVNW